MRFFSTITLLAALVFVIAGQAPAQPPGETPTPVAWGLPLEGGPIRVLFIAPQPTTRDAIELAQRLELKYKLVPLSNGDDLDAETTALLREHLADKLDVIVLGNFEIGILPDDIIEAIIHKVENGAGLLLAHHHENIPTRLKTFLDGLTPAPSETVTRGIGASLTAEWASGLGFVKTSQYKQGRVVELNYVGGRPFSHFLIPALSDPLHARQDYFDTYLSLAARAVRWLANREPAIWVAGMEEIAPAEPPDEEIPPDLPTEYVQAMRDAVERPLYATYRFHFNEPAPKRYEAFAQIREPNRELHIQYPDLPKIHKGAAAYRLELPLGPGTYFLDFWIRDRNKTVEWNTEIVTIKRWPEISNLRLSKSYLLANDTLTISLNIQPQYHQPRPCTVHAWATDSLGRVVAKTSRNVAPEGGLVQLALTFADLISNLLTVEIFAADSLERQPSRWYLDRTSHASVYLPVRSVHPPGAFSFAAEIPENDEHRSSNIEAEYNIRRYIRTLAELGVDSVFAQPTEAARFYLADANLRPIPELTRYAPEKEPVNNIRIPCLSDPKFQETEAAQLRQRTTECWTIGTTVYSLGKGNALATNEQNCCPSPTCLAGFQDALREQYGSLDALNRAWKTGFVSWETVTPASRENAASLQNDVPWIDFRRYMDNVFCAAHTQSRNIVREIDLDARVGFQPLHGGSAYLGYDWWLLANELDALVIEPDEVLVEMLRSYAPPEAYTGLVFNLGTPSTSSATLENTRWFPWYAALHGMESVWLASNPSPPTITALAEEIAELKSGMGDLLIAANRVAPAVAIYGSQTSHYARQMKSSFGSETRQAEARFIHILEDHGYQYDFVSYAQAAQGGLDPYRVLIVPAAQFIGDSERKTINTFKDRGGLVISDETLEKTDAERVVLDALDTAAVEPAVSFTPKNKSAFYGECMTFRYDQAEIVALLANPREGNKSQKLLLHLDPERTVYNIRQAKRMTRPKKVRVDLEPGETALLATLPYEVSELILTAPTNIAPGERLPVHILIKTQKAEPGTHLVNIKISRIPEHPLPHYAKNVICPVGEGETYIPLAFNDTPGTYIIKAQDILSGTTGQKIINVGPKSFANIN